MKHQYILGMIVILVLMLWVGSELLKSDTKPIQEGFVTASGTVNINLCPTWAPQIQTAKGNTDCCTGSLVDGKCSGNSFCSLSPPHDGVPSCLDAWKKYYRDKSQSHCPPSMPHYFEDLKNTNNPIGCSQSPVREDGSNPQNPAAARCRIYKTEKENRTKMDSCFIEKERIKIRCPPHFVSGFTSTVDKFPVVLGGEQQFGFFVCNYVNTMGQRTSCNDDKTTLSYWDRENPNWKSNRSRYTQLENISCRTFTERERMKEMERRRLEELRRRAEEARRRAEDEKRRREQMASRFRGFFNNFRQKANDAAAAARRALEDQKRRAEQQRRNMERQMQEMRNRLRRC